MGENCMLPLATDHVWTEDPGPGYSDQLRLRLQGTPVVNHGLRAFTRCPCTQDRAVAGQMTAHLRQAIMNP